MSGRLSGAVRRANGRGWLTRQPFALLLGQTLVGLPAELFFVSGHAAGFVKALARLRALLGRESGPLTHAALQTCLLVRAHAAIALRQSKPMALLLGTHPGPLGGQRSQGGLLLRRERRPRLGMRGAGGQQAYGGLPHILAELNDESKSGYLGRLNNEIYLKDICERYNIRDENGMESLMKVIASAVGSLSNAQKIADTFKSSGNKSISMPTISNYIRYLQESFIIHKAERFDIKGRKYISTPSKYYYSDLGLRNALLNFRQFEETHLMENAIYNELIYRGYSVDVGVVEMRVDEDGRKIRKQLEVDFVVNHASKRYYIQSAFALPNREKVEQEQISLVKIPDSFKKIIVVGGGGPIWRTEEGITIIGIFDFMLNENSLDL